MNSIMMDVLRPLADWHAVADTHIRVPHEPQRTSGAELVGFKAQPQLTAADCSLT